MCAAMVLHFINNNTAIHYRVFQGLHSLYLGYIDMYILKYERLI